MFAGVLMDVRGWHWVSFLIPLQFIYLGWVYLWTQSLQICLVELDYLLWVPCLCLLNPEVTVRVPFPLGFYVDARNLSCPQACTASAVSTRPSP